MTIEQIKAEMQNKIKEYEMQSKLVSQEVINRLNDLIKRMETKEVKPVEKEIKVEVKEEEKPIRSRWKSQWK